MAFRMMTRESGRLRWICALLLALVGGCSSPSKEEKLRDAQQALVAEAMNLQRCLAANGYTSEKCARQRKRYEADLAEFKTTFSK